VRSMLLRLDLRAFFYSAGLSIVQADAPFPVLLEFLFPPLAATAMMTPMIRTARTMNPILSDPMPVQNQPSFCPV